VTVSWFDSLLISAARPTRHGLAFIQHKVRHLRIFNTLEAIIHAPIHTRRSYRWRR